ncbi:MAG TPA: hypothetical protein VGK59_02320 [Ohtaekwangia sp.]
MKRRLAIIVMVTQSVIILLMMMYAFVQKAEAEKQHQRAVETIKMADSLSKDALERERKMLHVIDSLVKQKAD